MGKLGYIDGSPAEGKRAAVGVAMPPQKPLDMPRQSVGARRQRLRARAPLGARLATGLTRLILLAATAAMTAYGVYEIHGVMAPNGITWLQWIFIGLFALNFAWISFAASQAVLGFLRQIWVDLTVRNRLADTPLDLKTAILVPVYNENPHAVAAAVKAMADGVAELAPGHFSFFVLSDTTKADAWVEEEDVFLSLIQDSSPNCPIYYRHRRFNTERKAGNLGDWVARWGGGYDAMLVLDADSLMAPQTILEMARRLQADPGLGLIQTLPSIFGGRSLYARMQQFANRCYGPIFGHGLAAWHGMSSNFWGHNAIIRVKAFAEAAHLPELSGRPPFGGHVLSHDFIEAAFLRRAGWGVRFDTDLPGSFEQAPPSFIDMVIRERRWCQGNLQHARFLFARGMTLVTRLHLLAGIQAYMSALFWFALVLVGFSIAIQADLSQPDYFTRPSLFPTWPVFDSQRAIALFIVAIGVVLLPKVLGWLRIMLNPVRMMRYGGPLMVTISTMIEIILSALYAPIMMVAQASIVVDVLTGKDSGWSTQRRDDGGIPIWLAFRAHFWHVLIGIALGVLAYAVDLPFFFWMLPVTAGLVLAPILSWLSGSAAVGMVLKHLAILRTPEEQRRTRLEILKAYEHNAQGIVGTDPVPALDRLAEDKDLRNWHLAQLVLKAGGDPEFDPALIVARSKANHCDDTSVLQKWLTKDEIMALLHDSYVLRALFEDAPSNDPLPVLEKPSLAKELSLAQS